MNCNCNCDSAENITKRLKVHNSGKVRYTKGHKPYVLHYHEKFDTREEAVRRERFFKSIDGYLWLKSKGII
jgi:putative endonuclease